MTELVRHKASNKILAHLSRCFYEVLQGHFHISLKLMRCTLYCAYTYTTTIYREMSNNDLTWQIQLSMVCLHNLFIPPIRKYALNKPLRSVAQLLIGLRAYSIVVEPSSVRPPVHTFKYKYLRKKSANHNHILSEASFGLGKG